MQRPPIRIAVFGSGSGTNAQALIERLKDEPVAQVALVVSNNTDAYILKRAQQHSIATMVLSPTQAQDGTYQVRMLQSYQIDLVVLAGYMRLVPPQVVAAYPERILNVHPALLPKFGGQGMYGDKVHAAVLQAGEAESGMTIHYVNERYDEGAIIAQHRVAIQPGWQVADLRAAVQALEHQHYPEAVLAAAKHFALSNPQPQSPPSPTL